MINLRGATLEETLCLLERLKVAGRRQHGALHVRILRVFPIRGLTEILHQVHRVLQLVDQKTHSNPALLQAPSTVGLQPRHFQ